MKMNRLAKKKINNSNGIEITKTNMKMKIKSKYNYLECNAGNKKATIFIYFNRIAMDMMLHIFIKQNAFVYRTRR